MSFKNKIKEKENRKIPIKSTKEGIKIKIVRIFLSICKNSYTFAALKIKIKKARSSSRLGRQVFILEIRGSSPLRATIIK